jgi:hypothetical protein
MTVLEYAGVGKKVRSGEQGVGSGEEVRGRAEEGKDENPKFYLLVDQVKSSETFVVTTAIVAG